MATGISSELNALTTPLFGKTLIEASAGTGKTFTIASLYLRLLLGHGTEDTKATKPLSVEEILVVTFTEAATEELRDRIRRRIRESRIAFSRGFTKDPVIAPLLEEITDHESAAAILLQAERQMDEASIFTIHGFCNRILTQNAFESGSLFNTEFLLDESDLRFQVVADFWRKQFYPLSKDVVNEIVKVWTAPMDLKYEIDRYISGAQVSLSNEYGPDVNIETLHHDNLNRIHVFKHKWLDNVEDIHTAIALSGVSKRSYTKKSLPKWIDEVSNWARMDTEDYSVPSVLSKFSVETLEEKTGEGLMPPNHFVFSEASDLINKAPSLKEAILEKAIRECRIALHNAKLAQGLMSFDDLLTNLSNALDKDKSGHLADRIRKNYPFAMIDEFQDTDPLQFNIFNTIYNKTVPADQSRDYGLFMIGDPKQAIYAFRGGDIFTYIKARRMVSNIYTLGTNWRSSYDVVNGVNSIFSFYDNPFIYNKDVGFQVINSASKKGERALVINDSPQKAIKFWDFYSKDGKPAPKGDYQDQMAKNTAFEIQRLLELSSQGKAHLKDKDKQHPIKAGDIAILVRTGRQAKLIQKTLAKQNIASVYMSSNDSVFATEEAKDILRLLNAVTNPKNDMAIRNCLVSTIIGMTANEVDNLNIKDGAWDSVAQEFNDYKNSWSWNGILPMIRRVITHRSISAKLLSRAGGERILTNILHIAELLQEASQTIDSESGLIKWLEENIKNPNGNSSEQQLRLESDRNLVQVVTIHKSKGLEYDIVFLPFMSSYRESDTALYHDESLSTSVLDLKKTPESLAKAEMERVAEDLRILYVALTRPVYSCYIGVAPIRNGRNANDPSGAHMTGLGYILQHSNIAPAEFHHQCLDKLVGVSDQYIEISEYPELPEGPIHLEGDEKKEVKARNFTGHVETDFWITSFSSLSKHTSHGHHNAVFESSTLAPELFEKKERTTDVVLNEEVVRNIFTFPKGAVAGTFLHTIFEEVEYTQSAYEESNAAIILSLLEMNNLDAEWLPTLQKLVDDVMSTDMDGNGLKLNKATKSQRLVEMEFMLPISDLKADDLNAIMSKHERLFKAGGKLAFDKVSGLLKGFIDLVFEQDGKFYVLDWKSNYLGDDIADYHVDNIEEAMADHRYDLQYNLYCLALDRYLSDRIPDYSYEKHFGGVLYIFLRGIDGQTNSTGVYYAKPSIEMLKDLNDFADGTY